MPSSFKLAVQKSIALEILYGMVSSAPFEFQLTSTMFALLGEFKISF